MKLIIWDLSGTIANPREEKLYKGAKEVLQLSSKKYKQVLVTTSINPKKRIYLIKKLGIWKYFDYVKISLKTEEIFLQICEKFNCTPEETFVIGDGYKWKGIKPKEIFVGNKLGMKTIWTDFNNTSKFKEKIQGIKYWKKITHLSKLKHIL